MRHFSQKSILTARALGAAALGAALVVPAAVDAADFKGKRIIMYVAASPGGGYAAYARTVAKNWGRHIPGNPKIMVKHKQGASGVVALNYLYAVAKRDGTEVLASKRKTKIKIAGKKAKRGAVKAGMTCTIAHQGHRSTAKSITCK